MINFAELANVAFSLSLAYAIAAMLVIFFIYLGKYNSLDEKIFPSITERQKALFGFIGFYLLILTGFEILNPQSFVSLSTSNSISYKPSFLSKPIGDISIQDGISIVLLLILIIWLIVDSRKYSKKIEKININVTQPQKINTPQDIDIKNTLKNEAGGLSFALFFSARSFLIGLFAPGLILSPLKNLGLLFILGVFLISGIYCFIESMKIGGWLVKHSNVSNKFWKYVWVNIILNGFIQYLFFGILGYFLYTIIPGLFNASQNSNLEFIPTLIQTISKITAGIFIILGGYLVAWGLSGLSERIGHFMLTISLSVLIFPVFNLIWNFLSSKFAGINQLGSKSDMVYAIILLILPFLAYSFGKNPNPTSNLKPKVAFIKNISWLPFALGGIKIGNYSFVPYSSSEELLENTIGQTARIGGKNRILPSPVRHFIAKYLNLHKEFDAIILDIDSAIRLIDGIEKQRFENSVGITTNKDSSRYFIIAGVSKRKDCIFALGDTSDGNKNNPNIWHGPTYLPSHKSLDLIKEKILKEYYQNEDNHILVHLPSNCVDNYLESDIGLVVLPEPFATDITLKLKTQNMKFTEYSCSNHWFINKYDVLLVRSLDNVRLVKDLIMKLSYGHEIILDHRTVGNPSYENIDSIISDIDTGENPLLNPLSLHKSCYEIDIDDVTVVDQLNYSNWKFIEDHHQQLIINGLITLPIEKLKEHINCSFAREISNPILSD